MSFRYIPGNPPYNRDLVGPGHSRYYDDASGITGKMGNYGFIRVAFDRAEEGGVINYIMPTNFMIIANGREFRKVIKAYDIRKIHVMPCVEVWKEVDVSGDICRFVASKTPYRGNTTIQRVLRGREFSTTVDLRNLGLPKDMEDQDIIPVFFGDHGRTALNKVLHKGTRLVRLEADKKYDAKSKPVADETYRFPVIETPGSQGFIPNYHYTRFAGPDMSMIKVAISHMQHDDWNLKIRAVVDNGVGWVNPNCNYFVCETKDEAEMLARWVNHPLFKICFLQLRDIQKAMDYNIGFLTKPDLKSDFTNQDVYSYYNLVPEEIEFVETFFDQE